MLCSTIIKTELVHFENRYASEFVVLANLEVRTFVKILYHQFDTLVWRTSKPHASIIRYIHTLLYGCCNNTTIRDSTLEGTIIRCCVKITVLTSFCIISKFAVLNFCVDFTRWGNRIVYTLCIFCDSCTCCSILNLKNYYLPL